MMPVKPIKYTFSTALILGFVFAMFSDGLAQGNMGYRELAMRSQQPPLFFDFVVLPGERDSSVTFSSVFSLSYNFLPFKKLERKSDGKREFFSVTSLNMEVLHSDESHLDRDREISVEGLEPAGRTSWSDTAYAVSYEQTQSRKEFLSGHLSLSLNPGIYSYLLQMKRGEETDSRVSQAQSIRITPFSEMKTGNILWGDDLENGGETPRLKLISMGDNVTYGEDFYALAYLPGFDANAGYRLEINNLEVDDEDTTQTGQVYSQALNEEDLKKGIRPRLSNRSREGNFITLPDDSRGYTYALVKIPNSRFPNALYRLNILKEGQEQPVAEGVFRSIWIDMPTSLLNLDVAIDMLNYIVDKETRRTIDDGSQAEREQKFRKFWKQRDPTPKTEFNELMAEYYRRIDYAYTHFSTENVLGYESDQGEVYIKYGPPNDIDRKFPTDGPTTEIWSYPGRQFIFKATTGFGDFRLVSS